MKRFICVILAAAMIAALFAACGSQTVKLYKVSGATSLEADRSAVKNMHCTGSYDGKDDFDVEGDKAWEIYDHLMEVIKDAEEISSVPVAYHLINLWFQTEWDGSAAELGVFQVYDGGAIVYTEAMAANYVKIYTCDKEEYDKISEMLK